MVFNRFAHLMGLSSYRAEEDQNDDPKSRKANTRAEGEDQDDPDAEEDQNDDPKSRKANARAEGDDQDDADAEDDQDDDPDAEDDQDDDPKSRKAKAKERKRFSAVFASKSVTNNLAQAISLLCSTDLSSKQIISILQLSNPPPQQKTNSLDRRMNRNQMRLSADVTQATPGSPDAKAVQIIQAARSAGFAK